MTSELSPVPGAAVAPPPRIRLPRVGTLVGLLAGAGFFAYSCYGVAEAADLTLRDIVDIPANVWRILSEMLPPSFVRFDQVILALAETFHMALAGTVAGVLVSVPLAILAARNLSPHPVLYHGVRLLVSFARTVPDLVWAIFFVIVVGLGPLAGALTLMVDTIGFAGRFFAEAMEEVDPGPQEALAALGARRLGTIFCCVVPAALPSFVNTTLYSFERAVHSSVVLGLVAAGGIGMYLEEPMTFASYDQAATVVLAILVLVVAAEQISMRVRRRILRG